MEVKLDGNLPHDLATALRGDGHDVHTVVDEQLAGETDRVVVAAATEEGRILLTLDRGIGDLRHYPQAAMPASSYCGQPRRTRTASWASSKRLVGTHPLDELRGCVVIVEPRKVSIRRPEEDELS